MRERSDVWRGTQCPSRPSLPASKASTPLEPGHSHKEPEGSEEEGKSLLHWQTAAVTASLMADARWDEQSTDVEESEEELEMIDDRDNR